MNINDTLIIMERLNRKSMQQKICAAKNFMKGAKNVIQNGDAINVIKIRQYNIINKNNSHER